MAIQTLEPVVRNEAPQNPTGAPSKLGKEEFLKLFMAQMQYQNPLEPLKGTEFTAQLAQFSQLEQMWNINENLKNNQLFLNSLNNAQAVNFIGKNIKAVGNSVYLKEGDSAFIHYKLKGDAAKVFVHIYDTNGNLVTTLELKNQKAGEQKLEWDGKDDKGNSLGSGQYSFEIEAYDADEKRIDVTSYIQGEVTGVTYEEAIVYLLLGEQKIAISDVIEIKKNET